jgi:hypothetical protein
MHTRPRPVLGALDEPRCHRVEVNIFYLLAGGAYIVLYVCVPNLSRPENSCDWCLRHSIHRQDGAVLQVIESPT